MDKIYEARIRAVLDELYLKTTVAVPWDDVYMWFGTQKIAKTPFRALLKEWEELCDLHSRVWPERTSPTSLYVIRGGYKGMVIRRDLFDDEVETEFDELIA